MWDLSKYYRQLHSHPSSFASHMHTWAQPDGPSIILDSAVMFGDAPASNWAMRLSGFVAWLASEVANRFQPDSDDAKLAARILDWARSEAKAEEDDPRFSLIHSFISAFIDDFSI